MAREEIGKERSPMEQTGKWFQGAEGDCKNSATNLVEVGVSIHALTRRATWYGQL